MCVQVYDGSKAWWKEDDPCHPVNAYAASKLEGERYVQAGPTLSQHMRSRAQPVLACCKLKLALDRACMYLKAPAAQAQSCLRLRCLAFIGRHSREFIGSCTAVLSVFGLAHCSGRLPNAGIGTQLGVYLLQAEWPKHVILRASIIVGPQSPVPVSRPLFLQFIVQQLAEQKQTTFFTDEFRNPTYVRDIVQILAKLIAGEQRLHSRYMSSSGACAPGCAMQHAAHLARRSFLPRPCWLSANDPP